jgi:hypothetical protein
MNEKKTPFIAHCSFCGQGLLRFMRCGQCDAVVAVCDQCELTWRNIAAVHSNPRCAASGTYPACPVCVSPDARWQRLDCARVVDACLSQYMAGESV